jgi:hypothetical protein
MVSSMGTSWMRPRLFEAGEVVEGRLRDPQQRDVDLLENRADIGGLEPLERDPPVERSDEGGLVPKRFRGPRRAGEPGWSPTKHV